MPTWPIYLFCTTTESEMFQKYGEKDDRQERSQAIAKLGRTRAPQGRRRSSISVDGVAELSVHDQPL